MSYETKYHKTGQYRNAVKNLYNKLTFNGVDEDGNVIRKPIEQKEVHYQGTVKLHGTNANIVYHEDGVITLHSRERRLGTIHLDDSFSIEGDNAGFAESMYKRREYVRCLLDGVIDALSLNNITPIFPIKVSGEWCGRGVQKGVGVSCLDNKSLFIFGVKNGDGTQVSPGSVPSIDEASIFNICNFKRFYVCVNVEFPDKATVEMGEFVNSVEGECPVASALGVEECLVGEGIVWTPIDQELRDDTGLWFKTKGQKHSTSNVKKLVSASPEKLKSIEDFVVYAVTDNRLNQGLENVELDVKNTGKFIGWVNRDICQEESDVLSANGLEMKDVGKYISNEARKFFMSKL